MTNPEASLKLWLSGGMLLLILLIAGILAGVVALPNGNAPPLPEARPCAAAASYTSEPVVIISTRTAPEPTAALPAPVRDRLVSSALDAGRICVTVASPSIKPRRVEIAAGTQGPPADRATPALRDLQALISLLTSSGNSLTPAATPAVANSGADPLNLINQVTGTGARPGFMYIESSGLSDRAPLDRSTLARATAEKDVLSELKAADALPDLSGWDVVFSGIGAVGREEPPVPTASRQKLLAIWADICKTAKASTCQFLPS